MSADAKQGRADSLERLLGESAPIVVASERCDPATESVIRRASEFADDIAVRHTITGALLAAVARGDGRPTVLVRLRGIDRFAQGWGGDRLIPRLHAHADARVVALVDAGDVDGWQQAAQLGAEVVELGGPELAAPQPFAQWFGDRYGTRWQPWMLRACVGLAAATDRPAQARFLRASGEHVQMATAHRRLRVLRAALCGELRDQPGEERRAALHVLERYGRSGHIDIAPLAVRSIQHAARAIKYPPLRGQLPLSRQAITDVTEVALAQEHLTHAVRSGAGRPAADAWRVTRAQAIGRVASSRAVDREACIAERDRIAATLDETISLIHDAWDDLMERSG